MNNSRWERLAPLSGVGFAVLLVAAVIMGMSDSPDFVGPPEEIAQYYLDDTGRIIGSGLLGGLSVFLLLWFLGSMRTALRRAEGGEGRLSALAYGGGVTGSALLLASFAARTVTALRADDNDTIAPEIAAALTDLADALGGIAAPIAFSVLLIAAAVLTFRFAALPRWLGWVSAVIGIGLLIGPIAFAVMLLFVLWVLVVSILMYRSQPAASMA